MSKPTWKGRVVAAMSIVTLSGILLAGCASSAAESPTSDLSNLQAMIDMEVEYYLENGDSEEDARARAAHSALQMLSQHPEYTVEDILSLGFTREELVRGAGLSLCGIDLLDQVVGELTIAVERLGAVGVAPQDIVTACLATGQPEEAIFATGVFSAEAIALAERPAGQPSEAGSGPRTWWQTAMDVNEGRDVCDWFRNRLGEYRTLPTGGNGLQGDRAPGGSYFECNVAFVPDGQGPAEINISFYPYTMVPSAYAAKHCEAGNLVGTLMSASDRGGVLTNRSYEYCINNTLIVFSKFGAQDFPLPEVVEWMRARLAGDTATIAGFVSRFEEVA